VAAAEAAVGSDPRLMRNILNIFFKAEGSNPWLVVTCLVLASTAEGLGIAAVVPLLTIVTESEASASPVMIAAAEFVETLGLELSLGPVIVFIVLGLLGKAALLFIAMRYVGFTVAEVETILRRRLVGRLLGARWSYVVDQQVGRFANAAHAQAAHAGEAYAKAAVLMALSIETAVLIAMSFLVSWELALSALVLGGLLAWALSFLVVIARKAGRKRTVSSRELVSFLSDAVGNIKPIKAMGRQGAFNALFEKKIRVIRRSTRRRAWSKEALKNLQEALSALILGAACYVAIAIYGFELADLVVVGILLARAVRTVGKVQTQYQAVASLEAPAQEIRALIAEVEAAQEREAAPDSPVPNFEREVVYDRVSFAHGRLPVLRDVRATLRFGELVVLTGPSGSGKTTFIDLLLGFHYPSSGEVRIDGVPMEALDVQGWRRRVGYVPQELTLFHDTVRANITLGDPAIGEEDVEEALGLAGAADFVAAMPDGLDSVVGERGGRLSGGQRQRIALARALAGRPRLLILDEVTSALDPETEEHICANIERLRGRMSVLAIAHRPAMLRIADQVLHLDAGRLVDRSEAKPAPDVDPGLHRAW